MSKDGQKKATSQIIWKSGCKPDNSEKTHIPCPLDGILSNTLLKISGVSHWLSLDEEKNEAEQD